MVLLLIKKLNWSPWPESASELYRPSDRRLSAKLVPTFADRWCHVVSVTDPYGRILGFLVRSSYFFLSSSSIVLTWLSEPCSRYHSNYFQEVPSPSMLIYCHGFMRSFHTPCAEHMHATGRWSLLWTRRIELISPHPEIHFNIIIQLIPLLFPPTCALCLFCPLPTPWLDHSNYIWREAEVKLCYLLDLLAI
jgi:hypothetical protein